jgi:hypothetical protein
VPGDDSDPDDAYTEGVKKYFPGPVVAAHDLAAPFEGGVPPIKTGLDPTNHGGSWSVYFSDPEGNRIELLAQTPWYVPPISVPLDLSLSDAEIYSLTGTIVEEIPGHMLRARWREQLEHRLNNEGTIERRPSPSDEAALG